VASSGCFGKDAYQFLSEIPIGGEGGWDILTIDPTANRLYLSHATKVVVVDLGKNSVIGEITDTPGVHAFVAVPELQRGFSSNGKEDKASVVDLKTLQTTSKIDTGPNPDAIVYEPKRHEVYVFNHTGNSCTVIDPKSASVITTIQLGGSPEFAAVDKAAGRIYCNIEDKAERWWAVSRLAPASTAVPSMTQRSSRSRLAETARRQSRENKPPTNWRWFRF